MTGGKGRTVTKVRLLASYAAKIATLFKLLLKCSRAACQIMLILKVCIVKDSTLIRLTAILNVTI